MAHKKYVHAVEMRTARQLPAKNQAMAIPLHAMPKETSIIGNPLHKLLVGKTVLNSREEERKLTLNRYLVRYLVEGSVDNLSNDIVTFIVPFLHLPDVVAVYVVDELGFPDVWFICDELSLEAEMRHNMECCDFLEREKLSGIHFMFIARDRLMGPVASPLAYFELRRR